MKGTNTLKRKLITTIALSLLLGAMPTMLIGCSECKHKATTEEILTVATCGASGKKIIKCEDCEYSKEEMIPATEKHTYGSWIHSSATSIYRTCTECGSIESTSVSGEGNDFSSDTYNYTTFSSFEADCVKGGNALTYNGSYNKIIVSLGGGNYTNTCENKKVIIPARVTDIQFMGISSGSPFKNFTIEFEERVHDINLTFNDVRIEAESVILKSTSREINVNIKMFGQKCSFKNIATAASGADGINGATNDDPDVWGDRGADGTPAFMLNGSVTIFSQATTLEIQGGNGGDGGDGGHIATSGAPSGGNGGNGGDAIQGEELANVYVASNCFAYIQGGAGGSGGAPGKSEIGYWGQNRTGKAGEPGAKGNSGCMITYQ